MPAQTKTPCPQPARQRGQALVYGIFVLCAGLTALFFMFNTGQVSGEKTKLVNTADAVAYSAGVLHARVLNFDAYTNRALMANEVLIAQLVSVSSWVQYAQAHVDDVPPMNCYEVVASVPLWLALTNYVPLCVALSTPPGATAVRAANRAFEPVATTAMAVSETAKDMLQKAQTAIYSALPLVRRQLMRDVADANYLSDGVVRVDELPLTDDMFDFDGKPFIRPYSDNDRTRFKDVELGAAYLDGFVQGRSWSSHSPWPCILMPRGDAERQGATELHGFDEWSAHDHAHLSVESWHIHMFSMGCERDHYYPLGKADRSANKDAGGGWKYSGVPRFYDLSETARADYHPGNADPEKRDPHLRFSIRLTRPSDQERTTAGRAGVKVGGELDLYQGKERHALLAALATSEVFFDRMQARADGKAELASLFNPYWQVHLVENSKADLAAAVALQGGPSP